MKEKLGGKRVPRRKAARLIDPADAAVEIDLLDGVSHPSGWRVEIVTVRGRESLLIQMPRAGDALRAFLARRGLWDDGADMACAEWWAVSDAQFTASEEATSADVRQARDCLGSIALKGAARLDPGPLERLVAAVKARKAWEKMRPQITRGSEKQSVTTSLYRTAFDACCRILRRLPTKGELTREAEEWTLRRREAAATKHTIPTAAIQRVPAKSYACRSADRKAAGLDWLPDDHKAKGQRREA